jgi:hypothetical protein
MSILSKIQNRQVAPWSQVAKAGAIAALGATIINLIFFFITRTLGLGYIMPMRPELPPEPLPASAVIFATVMPTIAATLFFLALGRFTKQPVRIFLIIAVVFLLFSFGGPMTLPASVTLGTKMALNVMHVFAGVIIVGVLVQMGTAGE